MNQFKNKIALVTGAGEGLGQALCLELAAAKAIVICTDKTLELAQKTEKLIFEKTQNNSAHAFKMDVSDVEQISDVISKVVSILGKIDYLFNNAGVIIGGEIRDLQVVHWKKVIDINLLGLVQCSTEVFRIMSQAKQGHIVNITSISGLLDYTALNTPYAVSKHGAVTFSKALQMEAIDFDVKVTTVCPGAIKTSIGHNMQHVNANEEMKQQSIDFVKKGITSEKAAQKILKGVLRNKKMILFPATFKNYYYFTRLFRFIERGINLKIIRDFRVKYRLN